jgi:hypothetical protein
MSIWAWLAIGCVAILVLGGAATAVGVWWFAHKAKAIAADMQAHPETAAVRMAVAMNPDLELVSTDEAAGKVTIKNTKTGEVVTLDMADVKNGNISFTGSQGQASINFDQQAGRMEIKGANGEVASFGGSAQLPDWVPMYPGATAEGVFSSQNAEGSGGTFALTSSDSVDQIFAFYKGQLEGAGYKVTETHYSVPGGNGGIVAGESSDGRRTLTFTLATEEGKTKVGGAYSEKNG